MALIKVKTPAKINLTLEIVGKLPNGFHEIKSIMSAINLYDYLTFNIENSDKSKIILSGNNPQIPYNEKNLVYKAIQLFLDKTKISDKQFEVYIEKNIPVEAGLAGGSTNAAGTLFALNKFFNNILNEKELNELCAALGSDLNFCLNGGCCLCKGRGEKITPLNPVETNICLIKPKTFGISAKEAYTKFAKLTPTPNTQNTEKFVELNKQQIFNKELLINHLEMAVIDDYPILKEIRQKENAMMSGSGPTMFCLKDKVENTFDDNILVINNLKTINTGVEII